MQEIHHRVKELPLHVIDNENALSAFIVSANSFSSIAFDLEFDRDRHTYGFDLCLIQIATKEASYIIDPFPLNDLQPVFDLFQNPAIQKLVHCPGEDLRLLHSLGCYPKNLCDTEVIAKLLNYEHTSLAKLLEAKCDVQLNKKMQQSNWHRRPLTEEQVLYAKDDVVYLHTLYEILFDEIEISLKRDWVLQEFGKLGTIRYTLEKKTNFLKFNDQKSLSPYDQYVLNEIFILRDTIAMKKNKPAFMIMPEEAVRLIASEHPNRLDSRLPGGLHPSLRHGNALQELKENIFQIHQSAVDKKLGRQPEKNGFSGEERAAYYRKKKRQIELKETLFGPVQKKMSEDLGEFTSRFILSNAWVTKWLNGDLPLSSLQPDYKLSLIQTYCHEMGIDAGLLSRYEEDFGNAAGE